MWSVLRARACSSRYASNPQPLLQPWKQGFSSLSTTVEIDSGVSKRFLDLQEIEKILTDVQADDVKIIPVPKHSEWADFMVLATGKSPWHVRNIAQALIYKAGSLFEIFYLKFKRKKLNICLFILLLFLICILMFLCYQAKQKQIGAQQMMLPSVQGQEDGKWIVIDSGICCFFHNLCFVCIRFVEFEKSIKFRRIIWKQNYSNLNGL